MDVEGCEVWTEQEANIEVEGKTFRPCDLRHDGRNRARAVLSNHHSARACASSFGDRQTTISSHREAARIQYHAGRPILRSAAAALYHCIDLPKAET